MRKNLFRIAVIMIMVVGSFFGCAKRTIYPSKNVLPDMSAQKELDAAKGAIEKARNEGKDKECPKAFKEAVTLWEKAVALVNAQKINEAIDEARAAGEKAEMLCPDADGDGVTDEADKCPHTPENVMVDKSGCPLDSDGDGVPDYRDKCPGTSKNQKVNTEGCWVCESLLNFDLKSAVNFDFDKFIVKTDYYAQLGRVVDCLKLQPSIKVEIIGHTCSIGTKEYNQALSEKRARAVMRYFLEKGIAKDRLSTKGFGLTRPIASNETKEGRKKNRRVELNLLFK